MGRRARIFSGVLLGYLLAATACLVCVAWPNFEGHVHAPFTSFPYSLIWIPVSPYIAAMLLAYNPMKAILALAIFLAVFAGMFRMIARPRASSK